jgi:hypothetical protein
MRWDALRAASPAKGQCALELKDVTVRLDRASAKVKRFAVRQAERKQRLSLFPSDRRAIEGKAAISFQLIEEPTKLRRHETVEVRIGVCTFVLVPASLPLQNGDG